jgi:hydrogenase large subunit
MKLSPEVNLLGFAHYIQALEYQRKSVQAVAILGSKSPHIQNLTVGGVSNAINLDSLATLNMDRLVMMKKLMDEVKPFVDQVYLPDVCAIAGMYADWFNYGAGVTNYLASPDLPTDSKNTQFDLVGGYLMDGNLSTVHRFDGFRDKVFVDSVTEEAKHAYYKNDDALHPWNGETDPEVTEWQAEGKYSWVKAPRFQGRPMQVGPLAQILVGYASGDPLTRKHTDKALDLISTVAGRKIGVNQLQSTMGRHVARAIRASMLAELGEKHWNLLVNNIASGDVAIHNSPVFPAGEIQGVGVHEAPRGLLSHWTVIKGGKIDNYQAVVPSTWNASPRDAKGQHGPYEASLLHNPIADPARPLEAIRTIHSFDPCMACACHTFDPEGNAVGMVKVL